MKKAIMREQIQAVVGCAEREFFGVTLKKTFRYLSLAALALMGAVMTGCSSDNNIIDEPQQPANKDNIALVQTLQIVEAHCLLVLATTLLNLCHEGRDA